MGTLRLTLTGLAYKASKNGSEDPLILVFSSATDGTSQETGDPEISPFTYVLSPNGTFGNVRVVYSARKYDDYAFDFAHGTFTRMEYERGVLKDTDTGNFALSP
ncbi:MAG: hypothetical protein H7A55_20240 [Verrucomicrobiaceae bacterium]|nr:hypothetical protein [Verrucomicrobiaceae bacterium]